MEEENLFAQSQQIFDKLNYINFQKKFLVQKNHGHKIPEDYFAIQVNKNEQFEFFKNLSKWLLMQCRVDTSEIMSYSDPNTIIQNILDTLEQMGYEEAVNLEVIQIKNGYGDDVCKVINFLLKKVFQSKSLTFKQPIFAKAQEKTTENDVMDELEEEEGLQENHSDLDMESEEEIGQQQSPEKVMIETNADEQQWYKECERVANRLKVNKINDQNEWRMHFDQLKKYSNISNTLSAKIKPGIENILEKVGKKLDKISTNQNMLNSALSEHFDQLKGYTEQKKQTESRIQQVSQKVKELNEEYTRSSNHVDMLQKKINDQNSAATNDEALLKIKSVIDDLKQELIKIDIRTGVLNNFVMNRQFREKKMKLENVLDKRNNGNYEFTIEEVPLEEIQFYFLNQNFLS